MAFVDVQFPYNDLIERAISRTLKQFRQSPVLLSILAVLAGEIQKLEDAICNVMYLRTPAQARGVNLEVLNRIVGQTTGFVNLTTLSWFTPDVEGDSVDQAPIWCINAPDSGSIPVEGDFSKTYLEGKIFRNMLKYCSVPEIQQFAKLMFEIDVSVVLTGPMNVTVVVADHVSNNTLSMMKSVTNVKNCESVYFLPVPAGFVLNVLRLRDMVDLYRDSEDNIFEQTKDNTWRKATT